MRSKATRDGNAAAAILSTAGDGRSGDGTAGPDDRTDAPAIRLVGGTGFSGAGASGVGTVDSATVAAGLFCWSVFGGCRPFCWICRPSLARARSTQMGLALLVRFSLLYSWIVLLCLDLGNLDLR